MEITRPAVVTFREIAKLASELTGRTVSSVPVEPTALTGGMVDAGLREHIADLNASFHVGMAKGRLGPASTAAVDLTRVALVRASRSFSRSTATFLSVGVDHRRIR